MEQFRSPAPVPSDADTPLFLFGAGRVVFVGRRDGAEWVLARGWRIGDRFSDVRSWRFASSGLFTAQVGRLVREESESASAEEALMRAGDWVALVSAG